PLHPPRDRAPVPGAVLLAGVPARRGVLPVPVPAVLPGALADLRAVDPRGPADLLRLRLPPQQAQPRRKRPVRLTRARAGPAGPLPSSRTIEQARHESSRP